MPVGPKLSLRESYILALMWEMEVRKIKEKISFANMIRESALLIKTEGKVPAGALDDYIASIAPFLAESEEEKKREITELLEREAKQAFRVSPVRMPSRKVVPFRRKK